MLNVVLDTQRVQPQGLTLLFSGRKENQPGVCLVSKPWLLLHGPPPKPASSFPSHHRKQLVWYGRSLNHGKKQLLPFYFISDQKANLFSLSVVKNMTLQLGVLCTQDQIGRGALGQRGRQTSRKSSSVLVHWTQTQWALNLPCLAWHVKCEERYTQMREKADKGDFKEIWGSVHETLGRKRRRRRSFLETRKKRKGANVLARNY